MGKKAKVYLGIGSNLGNRRKNITQVLKLLAETGDLRILKISPVYETDAVGFLPQGKFLNAAVKIETLLAPDRLLKRLKSIEKIMGRQKSKIRWGPRIIDIDILIYDDLVFKSKVLNIPHKLMHKRYFVLRPLKDIAPKTKHPLLKKTISGLFKELIQS